MGEQQLERESPQVTAHSWRKTERFVPRRVIRPIQRLMAVEVSSAAAVLVATVAALVVANSPLANLYHDFWHTSVRLDVAGRELVDLSLHALVNDALMTIFFLLVSLEIKRELVFGELRDRRAAALPIIAAAGGMVVPALIYAVLNAGGPHSHGWGIPMATDIAFAVAVLTLLGRRVPLGARLFLLTLAVVDDLGAILVIAVFYSNGLNLSWLLVSFAAVLVALALRAVGVRATGLFIALGILCWFSMHESGIHATIAGVVFGLITPAWALLPPQLYPRVAGRLVAEMAERMDDGVVTADDDDLNDHTLREIRRLSLETRSPLHRVETSLAPYVGFVIVPLFAFANAGLAIPEVSPSVWLTDPVVLGVGLGLVVGKTIGVFLSAWAAVRVGWARFPSGMTNRHLLGVAMCAGVGFTVAMFVANLAFRDDDVIEMAKLGIMVGSAAAAAAGYLTLRFVSGRRT